MKYTLSFVEAQNAAQIIRVIGGDSKTEIVFAPGADANTRITVYGGVRQVLLTVKTSSEATEPKKVIFETKTLSTLLDAVLALKKDVALDIADAISYVEVEGRARLAIVPLSDEEISGISLKKETLIVQGLVKAKDALKAFKVGASQCEDSGAAVGMNNVLVSFEEGKLSVTSINNTTGSTSSVDFADNSLDNMKENAEKYKTEKGLKDISVPVPKQIAGDIATLLSMSESTLIAASDKAIYLMPAGNIVYSAVLGAQAFTKGKEIIGHVTATPKSASVTVDAQVLKESISLIKKDMDLSPSAKNVILTTLTSGEVRLESIVNSESCVRMSTVEGECGEVTRALNPVVVLDAISALSGNLTINYAEDERTPIVIQSGTTQVKGEDIILVAACRVEVEDDEEEASDEAAETTEESVEDAE